MLSIIFPAYGKEKYLISNLVAYWKVFPEAKFVVAADGCSADFVSKLRQVEKLSQKKNRRMKILTSKNRLGKGGGIMAGFKIASGDLIGFADGDGSVSAADFARLVATINGYDIAIASRRVAGAKTINLPLSRKILSLGFNSLVRLLLRLDIKDTQCGAKVFKRGVIKNLEGKIKTSGFAFDVELLLKAKEMGYKIKEVPVTWVQKAGSSISILTAVEMFIELLKIFVKS